MGGRLWQWCGRGGGGGGGDGPVQLTPPPPPLHHYHQRPALPAARLSPLWVARQQGGALWPVRLRPLTAALPGSLVVP